MYYEALLITFCVIGFLLSLYSFYIERRIKQDPTYKPLCDVSDVISCSKPFTSAYSRLFGFSNAYAGLLFYAVLIVLVYLGHYDLVFYAALGAIAVSFYLAYRLYFTIRAFCLICNFLYVINILILFLSYVLYR